MDHSNMNHHGENSSFARGVQVFGGMCTVNMKIGLIFFIDTYIFSILATGVLLKMRIILQC